MATIRDRILDTHTFDLFSQKMLLEIEQASFSKLGQFTSKDNSLYYRNFLWVPTESLRWELYVTCHNHKLLGYPGIASTMSLIKQDYMWLGTKAQENTSSKPVICVTETKP